MKGKVSFTNKEMIHAWLCASSIYLIGLMLGQTGLEVLQDALSALSCGMFNAMGIMFFRTVYLIKKRKKVWRKTSLIKL